MKNIQKTVRNLQPEYISFLFFQVNTESGKQSVIRGAFIDPLLAIRTHGGPQRAFQIGTRVHQG